MRPVKGSSTFQNLPIKNPTQTKYLRFKRGINTMPDTLFDKTQKDAKDFLNDRLKTSFSKFME
jgi:hypothetical protein